MPNLSPITKVEKNKLTQGSVWLSMLEINIPSVDETVRIVNNNEDITWNGNNWQRFPFELDEVSENSNGETSQFQIKVGNVNNIIGQYIRQYEVHTKLSGFQPITVSLYIVNSKDLDNETPVYKTNLILTTSSINAIEVAFTVSARDLYRARTPIHKMYPNSCRFKFKDGFCAYNGSETVCDKTLGRCRELNNSANFGGFPTISNGGVNL